MDNRNLEFTDLPPFPLENIPTVPLLRISLKRLLDSDKSEEDKLWKACTDLGFFYLDLRCGSAGGLLDGDTLLASAAEVFELGKAAFELPIEEKRKYDMKQRNTYFGYKGFGEGVVDGEGRRDRNEFWNVGKDDVMGTGERMLNPPVLTGEESREKLKTYMMRSHAVVALILGKLNDRLGLPPQTLHRLHRFESISGDQVRWVKSPPQPMDDRQQAMGQHTDFGSVTILFNRLGGLQVLPPNQDSWQYVKPLNGHCIVNLGDAMVKFSAGILRSNLHRVVNPPGAQAGETRYSLVYFGRPEDDVTLKALDGSEIIDCKLRDDPSLAEGEEISAKDWILRKAMAVTGRNEKIDRENSEKRDSGIAA